MLKPIFIHKLLVLFSLRGTARSDSQCQLQGAVRHNSGCCAVYGITTLFSHQFLQQTFSEVTSRPPNLPVMKLVPFMYPSHISHVSSIAKLTPKPQHHSYITSTINSEVRGMFVHCRFGALMYEVSGNTALSETVVSPLYY